LGRVIKTNSIGTERNRLAKSVVLAIRELMKQTKPDDLTRDLAAYIVLALAAISDTIEVSVSAWEKRGYWVKADRFRLEWQWSETYSQKMRTALFVEDWPIVAATAVQIADKLSRIKVSEKHRLGTPWEGAWQQLSTEAPTIKR
jgi:hypothetical protein